MILLRRDSYLDIVKPGVKQDTMNSLRNAPVFGYALFPDAAIMTAEQDIQKSESSSVAQGLGPGAHQHTSWRGSHRYKPKTVGTDILQLQSNLSRLHSSHGGNSVDPDQEDVGVVEVPTLVFPGTSPLNNPNDNYCSNPNPQCVNLIKGESKSCLTQVTKRQKLNLVVDCHVACHAPIAHLPGLPQKKGVSPALYYSRIKHVKDVCCVNHCLFVPPALNAPNAVPEQNVGGRLQEFWQVWQAMGSNPRVVSILKEGYTLPFKQRPVLTRFPVVQSGYANPTKNMYLKEALLSLRGKLVVEKVVVKSSLAFYNRLFLVPKPNGKWRPILDLSQLNLFLNTGTFKMETPETIRLSLRTGEWVTSLDFSDAYFHIPIAPRSRKYLRFFLFHQTFQFKALPFGLATAPLEFTKVVKEVKLMAQARDIRIHQYLDDWLLRAPSPETCLQHTQTLLALCQQLGWVVNMNKSELVPKQVFNFVGYQFNLITSRVLPTQDRCETLQQKLRFMKAHHQCTVRQFMSLIGLLTATEKQVCAGRLHMRPIQWHLKRNWHVPEVLEKLFRSLSLCILILTGGWTRQTS